MAIQENKATQEELDLIKNFQDNIQNVTIRLGQLELKKLNIKKEKEIIDLEYEKLINEEKELGDNLKEKYGNSQIDLKTGEIIPTN
ncbi:hypothetical protein OAE25_00375 [Verrucomicrobiales bacterium]|jgi:hypothetical protein|nr:hypothetical protein [Schleiferiaceae bacterium]MDB4617100.1 hypothetical protein [Verrucomicrobiales bacterium]|tara:strand:- start:213 stop:470 length:258 start_codon:yes stop_codon:yes gene_type:complete